MRRSSRMASGWTSSSSSRPVSGEAATRTSNPSSASAFENVCRTLSSSSTIRIRAAVSAVVMSYVGPALTCASRVPRKLLDAARSHAGACAVWEHCGARFVSFATSTEATTDVGVVLQPHHEARARQRVEHRVALHGIEPAHFHRPADAHLVARHHAEEECLQLVEAGVEHQRSPHRRSALHSLRLRCARRVPALPYCRSTISRAYNVSRKYALGKIYLQRAPRLREFSA